MSRLNAIGRNSVLVGEWCVNTNPNLTLSLYMQSTSITIVLLSVPNDAATNGNTTTQLTVPKDALQWICDVTTDLHKDDGKANYANDVVAGDDLLVRCGERVSEHDEPVVRIENYSLQSVLGDVFSYINIPYSLMFEGGALVGWKEAAINISERSNRNGKFGAL